MKILIVEDDSHLRESMINYFLDQGHIVEQAVDFESGEDKLFNYQYDLAILDIGLPKGNGLSLIKILKKVNLATGVLIVSAKNSLDDKIAWLDLGADDYIIKPFHLSELNSRVNAIYRRRFQSGSNELIFQEFNIDTVSCSVKINDKELELSKKEYDLILYFITNANRVLTKSAIAEHLWGDFMDVADNHDLVYTHIKNLRKKVTEFTSNDYLKTIYGMGYKWTASINFLMEL